jgi:hypothetical protein
MICFIILSCLPDAFWMVLTSDFKSTEWASDAWWRHIYLRVPVIKKPWTGWALVEGAGIPQSFDLRTRNHSGASTKDRRFTIKPLCLGVPHNITRIMDVASRTFGNGMCRDRTKVCHAEKHASHQNKQKRREKEAASRSSPEMPKRSHRTKMPQSSLTGQADVDTAERNIAGFRALPFRPDLMLTGVEEKGRFSWQCGSSATGLFCGTRGSM